MPSRSFVLRQLRVVRLRAERMGASLPHSVTVLSKTVALAIRRFKPVGARHSRRPRPKKCRPFEWPGLLPVFWPAS